MQLICSFVSHMQKAGFHTLGLKISVVLYKTTLFEGLQRHPAGDVLWVFVEPGNVVP